MSGVNFEVTAEGVDAAVGDIARVEQAAERVAAAQTRRFTQTVDQIKEEVEYQTLRAAAAQRESQREAAATAQVVAAARRQSDALKATQAAQVAAATSAIQFTQRIQGVASAVSGLVTQFGGSNATTGLIASIAGTTAQFAQMGAAFGPQGAVVGGIIGALVPAFTALVSAENQAAEAARARVAEIEGRELPTLAALAAAIDQQVASETQLRELRSGTRSTSEQQAFIDQANEATAQHVALRVELERQYAALTNMSEAAHTAANAWRALRDEASIEQEVASLSDAVAHQRELTSLAQDEARARAASAAVLPGGVEMPALGFLPGEVAAPRRAGRRGPSADDVMQASLQDDIQVAGAREADELARATEEARKFREERELLRAAEERAADDLKAHQEARRALDAERIDSAKEFRRVSDEAAFAFSHGWTASLDEVNAAFRESNRALQYSGQQMMGIGRLMERSMVAVGNNIAEVIGGTMKGAFQEALGAWLDGSKSFVEAAEDMAKGVLKALVMEAIVQTVVELARGVSALAGIATAAEAPGHFAAAAAWAAVGVVAGGVGAAVGAFGGGGGEKKGDAGGGADSRSMGRDSVKEAAMQAPVTINVFPGGLTTKADLSSMVLDLVNHGARDGGRLDSRLLRGGGS